ncbi:hypothetical protein Cgig2_030211 [Carnegiea gigantea]|uniref:Uncharacterized protein n=1 Tax=Carnegiea gigantea TaxID=171969 RepID=A0A9Q1Q6P2_9CARY|nr:hypothetical protein Cgig2_030211 [Carnegiea gigantea]
MKKKLMRGERRKGIRAYGIILTQSLRIHFSLWDKSLQMPKNLRKHYPTIAYVMLETYISRKTCIAELVLDVKLTGVRGKFGLLDLKKIENFQLKPSQANILVAGQGNRNQGTQKKKARNEYQQTNHMLVQDQMQACDNTRSDACESQEHGHYNNIYFVTQVSSTSANCKKNNGVLDSIL